jgi:Polysaccharide deacetylase
MRLVYLGSIATGSLIAIGLVLVLVPAYVHSLDHVEPNSVLLSFSISNESKAPAWCNYLASVLTEHSVKATVFVTGKIADTLPDCVSKLSSLPNVDVGSQTYNYVNLTSIPDYSLALKEVKDGKQAVDKAGNINSKVFRAPFGATDLNIYSLLTRNNITADFSYKSQYNKYENGQFAKYDLVTYSGSSYSLDSVQKLLPSDIPIMINFDNTIPVSKIDGLVASLQSDKEIKIVNTSELTGLALTHVAGGQIP